MSKYKDIVTGFSVKRPWAVLAIALIAVIAFGFQFPKVNFDNDPENMLAKDEPVRLYHKETKEKFGLYDFVVVGVVNEKDPNGVFNVDTLGRIHRLTHELISLHRAEDNSPAVRRGSDVYKPKL